MLQLRNKKLITHFHSMAVKWGLYKTSVIALLVATIGYALSFILNSILANALTPQNYGEITAIFATATLLANILLLGNDEASVKFVPDYLEQKNYFKLHGLVRYYCWMVGVVCFSFLIIFVILSYFPLGLTWRYLWVTPFVAILTFFMMILRSVGAPNSSLISYSILPYLLYAICLMLMSRLGVVISLKTALMVYVVILQIIIFWQLIRTYQLFNREIFSAKPPQKDPTWLPTAVQLLMAVLLTQCDQGVANFLLKIFAPGDASQIGILNVIYTLTSSMWIPYIACSSVLNSLIAPAADAMDKPKLQSITNQGNAIMFSLGLILFLVFVFFGKKLLAHFGAFYVSGYKALLIVAFGNLIALSAGLASDLLEYALNPTELLKINIVGVVVVLGIGALLSHFYGLYGGALTLVLIQGGLTISYAVVLRKCLQIKAFSIF